MQQLGFIGSSNDWYLYGFYLGNLSWGDSIIPTNKIWVAWKQIVTLLTTFLRMTKIYSKGDLVNVLLRNASVDTSWDVRLNIETNWNSFEIWGKGTTPRHHNHHFANIPKYCSIGIILALLNLDSSLTWYKID